jgi:K+-sensing histidine kinase KdpD
MNTHDPSPCEAPQDASPAAQMQPAERVGATRGGATLPQDVLVAISGRPSSETLIRRGSSIARHADGRCRVLTVVPPRDPSGGTVERWRALAEQLHCSFVERRAADVGGCAVAVARELGVRHVVIGEPRRRTLLQRCRGSLVDRLIDDLPDTDVHVIAPRTGRGPGTAGGADRPLDARSRVMACIPPRPHMEDLIRRAARLAASMGGELRVVSVRTRQRSEVEKRRLGAYASLTHQLGGEYVTVYGSAAAPVLAAYARRILATEVLLARGRGHRRWTRGTLHTLVRRLSRADVDVHVLAGEYEAQMAAARRLNSKQAAAQSTGTPGTLNESRGRAR